MNKNVLIVEDVQLQAEQLQEALSREMPDIEFRCAYTQDDIVNKVTSYFFSVAIVDLRMDGFDIDGFYVIDLIRQINPYAKVIIVSAYANEYMVRLSEYLSSGTVLALLEKEEYAKWIPKLKKTITDYLSKDLNPFTTQVLERTFCNLKNEPDTYKKGVLFEDFVVGLFRQMGFQHIETRVKDAASNEVDIVVRNDISDSYFDKFSRYFFVECKNKPEEGFSKNDFIVFNNKVNSSSGDSNLGFVFTTGYIKKTVVKEALKETKFDTKIIYLASEEILRLIHTPIMIDELKEIMDSQVYGAKSQA